MTVAVIISLLALLPGSMLQNKQAHPNLSGTWVLVPAKSSFGTDQRDTTDYTVTVTQQEPEITFTVKYKLKGVDQVRQWSCYTDGRPVKTPVKDLEITTRWRGRKLHSRSHLTAPIDRLEEDEWELSNDGLSLTRTVSESFVSQPSHSVHEPSKRKYEFVRGK